MLSKFDSPAAGATVKLSFSPISQSVLCLFNKQDTVIELHCQEMKVKARLWKIWIWKGVIVLSWCLEISRIQYIFSSLKTVLRFSVLRCFAVLRCWRIFTIVAFCEKKIQRQKDLWLVLKMLWTEQLDCNILEVSSLAIVKFWHSKLSLKVKDCGEDKK